jgi:Ser/Thr protein kinase RdoA (MazF antagonist)
MTREIFLAYNLVEDELDIKPIGNGLINTTWLVSNGKSDFILQKINTDVFKHPESIAKNIRLLANYLHKNDPGYLFAVPLKTIDSKEMVHTDNNEYFRLTPYIKDSCTINTVAKPRQAYQAARQFGKFTRLLSQFPVEKLQITLPDFHNLILRYSQFEEALKKGNFIRIGDSHELINYIKANKNIVTTYQNILHNSSFKLRVTHHDTKISNVLFDKNDDGLCVIDLDTIMPGYFISDVGDMLRTYLSPVSEEEKDFSKIEIREDYFEAIRNGYMSEMKDELSDEEKKHFIYAGKFMIYMQAIRFLTDHLNNDVYYGAKYDGHNFVRAGNQIVLLQRLIEKEKALKSLIEKNPL